MLFSVFSLAKRKVGILASVAWSREIGLRKTLPDKKVFRPPRGLTCNGSAGGGRLLPIPLR